METTLDKIINRLKPSQSKIISQYNGVVCSVEMSGKGDVIRFIRTFLNGSWEVFKTEKIYKVK